VASQHSECMAVKTCWVRCDSRTWNKDVLFRQLVVVPGCCNTPLPFSSVLLVGIDLFNALHGTERCGLPCGSGQQGRHGGNLSDARGLWYFLISSFLSVLLDSQCLPDRVVVPTAAVLRSC
jgi:hypothetical protein